ncbi:hypothetical protein [Planobispora takensis]|uniref:Mce-associated membrane protein n=1 Tax=Planobispora takensis TaxID=1367882 RepID=A0A8J3WWC2_9ACTN|nr:hypothetical protein [Planobispora takensis]GII04706.1 hypothetical protein Pta02_67140 [Planobispora takensis]
MLRKLLPWLAGLSAVCLAAAAFWVGGQLREARAAEEDRRAALRAAGDHALSLLSIDHRTVDAGIRRILDTSTGPARAEYARDAATLKETTTSGKVLQTGALRAVGLVSLEDGTARVLVVGDAVVSSEGSREAPRERFYRWSMEVTRTGGGWLVSQAELVS